jgi:hypothetical protein
MIRRVVIASLALVAVAPGAALARPRTIARLGRLDYGPTLVGGRVAYGVYPRILLVDANGGVTRLASPESPKLPQPAQAHAATPEGFSTFGTVSLQPAANAVAWTVFSDAQDPGGDRTHGLSAYYRSPLLSTGYVFLGGFEGHETLAAPNAEALVACSGMPRRSIDGLALSDEVLAYAEQEPPRQCTDSPGGPERLVVRTAGAQLGGERVLAEAPGPSTGSASLPPFRGLRAAGHFVGWYTDEGGGHASFTVADAVAGAVVYQLADPPLRSGITLASDGTLAVGLADGTTAWASPAEPTLHTLGAGRPLASAPGRVLIESGRTLVLTALDGTAQPVAVIPAGERRAGSAGYDGTSLTWATRRRPCRRVRVHRRRRPHFRRVCRNEYRVHLQTVG